MTIRRFWQGSLDGSKPIPNALQWAEERRMAGYKAAMAAAGKVERRRLKREYVQAEYGMARLWSLRLAETLYFQLHGSEVERRYGGVGPSDSVFLARAGIRAET